MTTATIALAELAEKGSDIDVLRQMVQFKAQRLMDMDVQSRCGADGPTVWTSCPVPSHPVPSRTGALARSKREVVKLGLRTMVRLPWEGDREDQERNADQRDEPAVELKAP